MKTIAVLSDIHSNVWALDAVLADAQTRGADTFINLGDILYGPLAPQATFELLQRHPFITIQGNQDRQIYAATREEINANPTLQFIYEDLSEDAIRWMRSLPGTYTLRDTFFLCHGTPNDDLIYLLEDVSTGYPKLRAETPIAEAVAAVKQPWILCGHTHIPRLISLSNGQQIINPGSVGLPAYCDDLPTPHCMENGSPHARYGLFEQRDDSWHYSQQIVTYDTQPAIDAAISRDRHDWAHALRTGRAI